MENETHQSVVDLLQAVCEDLSQEEVTVQQVAERLGTLFEDRSIGLQKVIEPAHPTFADIQVVSESETSAAPSHLRIEMAADTALTLPALEATFGPSSSVPRMPQSAGPRFAFFVELPDQPYTCTIFATLSQEEDRVSHLTIRRDARLDE